VKPTQRKTGEIGRAPNLYFVKTSEENIQIEDRLEAQGESGNAFLKKKKKGVFRRVPTAKKKGQLREKDKTANGGTWRGGAGGRERLTY